MEKLDDRSARRNHRRYERGLSRAPQEPIDAHTFREAMSRLGAAVHVVTTDGPGGKAGFTATAVCSVSDEPPTLLVCLNRRSQITPVLQRNGILCINTLAADQSIIAEVFAGRTGRFMEHRFDTGAWSVLKSGSPVLQSAIVALDCRIIEVKAVATHNILFAVVEDIRQRPHGPALIYHDRAYKRI
ncbi:MAG TPA: flavin reductase [Candidatus Binataceae bacterium]|nr:flavin reductase [Candidatus Binataceae bacterium]